MTEFFKCAPVPNFVSYQSPSVWMVLMWKLHAAFPLLMLLPSELKLAAMELFVL